MKRKYSYFIIKPDGMRFLDDICNTIEQRYQSIRYYAIEDFDDIIKKLYYKHFEGKGEKFANSFSSYLYGLKELFGNYAILALVADSTKEYDQLMQSVFNTKIEIRNKYVNNNIGIVTNHGNGQKNYIRLISEDGAEKQPRIMNGLGSHRISDMNIIHCPDPNREDTLAELNILLQEGIIHDTNMITEPMMKQMRKYQTAKFQEDMREEGYQGGIQPDISGFVKSDIERSSDDDEKI